MTPSLARRARLKRDEARGAWVLLYPEGVVTLNESAAAVLRLVDGARDLDGVVDALAREHPDADPEEVRRDARELLDRLAARGFVAWSAP